MRLPVLLALTTLTVLVGFAPAPFPRREREQKRDDLESMQGLWRMTSYDSNGGPIGHNFKCRVKGGRWTFLSLDNGEHEAATYVLNLDYTCSPRAFEWLQSTEPTATGWVGSYRLEAGRRLTLIFGSGTIKDNLHARPTNFDTVSAYKITLDYLHR